MNTNHTLAYISLLQSITPRKQGQLQNSTAPTRQSIVTNGTVKHAQHNRSQSIRQPMNNHEGAKQLHGRKRIQDYRLLAPANPASSPAKQAVDKNSLVKIPGKPQQKNKALSVKAATVSHRINEAKIMEPQKREHRPKPKSGKPGAKQFHQNPKSRSVKGSGRQTPRVHDFLLAKEVHVRGRRQTGHATTAPTRNLQKTSTTSPLQPGPTHQEADQAGSTLAVSPTENGTLPATGIRFSNGSSTVAGYVEVQSNGEWGHICADGFTNVEAGVVCRQMAFPAMHARVIHGSNSLNSTGTDLNIVMTNVHCRGSEKNIQACQHKRPDEQHCNSDNREAVAVRCRTIRAGGHYSHVRTTGVIEVSPELFINDIWSSLQPDKLDNKALSVICHELGLGRDAKKSGTRHPNYPINTIQGKFQCTGNEDSLLDCPKTELTIKKSDDPTQDILCPYAQVDLRLEECNTMLPVKNGTTGCPEARILYREWGVFIDAPNSSFNREIEARVICYHLGYPRDGARFVKAQYDEYPETASYPVIVGECDGNEKDSRHCILLTTNDLPEPGTILAINCPPMVQVSNACGAGPDNQFLVMWHRDRWQFLEGSGFDNNAASVVCREMGYSGQGAMAQQQNLSFPVVDFLGWQELRCLGNETHFLDCKRNGPQVHNGTHTSAVTVFCENQRLNSTVTGATCQYTTPAPSTTQPSSPTWAETTSLASMPNDDNKALYYGIAICSLAGLTGLAVTLCYFTARKPGEHAQDSSPCQRLVNTTCTTGREPILAPVPYRPLAENTNDLDAEGDSEAREDAVTAV